MKSPLVPRLCHRMCPDKGSLALYFQCFTDQPSRAYYERRLTSVVEFLPAVVTHSCRTSLFLNIVSTLIFDQIWLFNLMGQRGLEQDVLLMEIMRM
jgi:hypothetical protein